MMSEPATESMHDALSDAFDESAVAESPEESVETSTVAAVETQANTEETATQTETGSEVVVDGVSEADVDSVGGDGDNQEDAQLLNAPQSWGVAEREGWAAIPPNIQAQIDKREKEIGNSLTTTGEARRFHEEFNTTIDPFKSFIQAEGASPMQAVGNLLQTAATLQGGSQQQKAQRIAELIGHYGIDIRTLDSLLAGEAPADPQASAMGDMLDQRLGPINQFMQQQQLNQQQQYNQQQETVNNELGSFMGANEFAKDVQTEMGDLMEMAGRRGETLDLKTAYERALMMRPDIQGVIQQRLAQGQAQQNNANVQQKQRAAVSVAGGTASVAPVTPPNDIRSALIAAMGD